MSAWIITDNKNNNHVTRTGEDIHSGEYGIHFWHETDDIDFTIEQTVTGLAPGYYDFSTWINGGDATTQEVYIYIKIDGEIVATATGALNGWQVWSTPEISEFLITEGTVTVGASVKANAKAWGTLDDFYFSLNRLVTEPDAPQNLSATPGDREVVLTWDAPESNGGIEITGYQISTDGVNWADVTGTTHTVADLTNGTEYTFYVRAVNDVGVSTTVSAKTTPQSESVMEYTITASANKGGTVQATTKVEERKTAEILVTADDGYKLVAIMMNGVTVDISDINNNVFTIENVQKDMMLRALFVKDGVDFADKFTDVLAKDENGDDTWYYDAVGMLTCLDIIDGTTSTTYEPDKDVTRAEFTKLLYELAEVLGIEVATSDSIPFTDMPVENYWAEGYIGWAYENDIVNGYNGSLFGPEDSIKRQDMALMMQRFFEEFMGYDLPGDETNEFADSKDISDYAEYGVEYVVKKGLMKGYEDGHYRPEKSTLRSEVAQVLYNYLID